MSGQVDESKGGDNVDKLQSISIADYEPVKIRECVSLRGQDLAISGWVHRLRRQGKTLIFLTLRDGSGFLQCVLAGKNLCQTPEALALQTEASVTLYGKLKELPPGKTAPGGHELAVTCWKLLCNAPPGGIDNVLNVESSIAVQLDQRHLMLRGEKLSKIMKFRSIIMQAFRDHYHHKGYYEVTPPTLVQTQCEGGSTLFSFKYFDEIVSSSTKN